MERYSEYKDSGVQWLGEIPGHWKNPSFKRVCKLKSGNSSVEEFSDEEIPFVRVSDMNLPGNDMYIETSKSFVKRNSNLTSIFPIGSVIFPKRGGAILTNKRRIVKKEICCDLNIMGAIPGSEVASKFLYYYLLSKNFGELYNGSAVPQINNGDIEPLPFPLPPLSEQHSIVSYLDDKCGKIDKMLEGKQKQIELLAEMKQRIIADAVTRGINPDVKMKATNIPWLPEIPEHWNCIKLKAFSNDNKEKNKGNVESCVLSLSYGNVIVKQNVNFGLVPDNYENYQIVKPGYIILRLTDLQNDHKSLRTGLVKNRGIITSAYVGLVVNNINHEYVHLLLHSYDVMKVFYGMGGGLRQSMSYQDISNLYIPVPPLSEQHAIVSYITDKTSKIDTLTLKLQQEIESIKEYKQRLISDVVTGQIKVC